MELNNITKRALIITSIVAVLVLACALRLYNLQIVHGEDYRTMSDNNSVRTYIRKAPRGEILDRNGVPIVENKPAYNVQIFKTDISNDALNQNLADIIDILRESDCDYSSTFPIKYNTKTGAPEYSFPDIETNDSSSAEYLDRISAWESDNKLTDYSTLREIAQYFIKKYDISGEFDQAAALDIAAVRYEMDERGFDINNPFIMATDVSSIVTQKIEESYSGTGFADIVTDTVRTYAKGRMAAHILGRTGIIYAEEYEKLKDDGYGMNDIIGKDGLEAVLEPYLKGGDGYRRIRLSSSGRYSEEVASKDPQPGNYAELTIDSELQAATESALKAGISSAVDSSGAGAAIAVDPNTGEVLAIASYPDYNPETFGEDYDTLINEKSNPLFNRALNGAYAPGSTFKILTSIAGLESGLIEPDTYITDRGVYTYFSDYRPTCLAYSSSGSTHGTINVSEAIGVSCNYFFYDIGRRMGIETIDEYCEKFGLGLPTGIELSEGRGTVAGPEERAALDQEWHPGDVLQAAIGQSDNLFTPAQIASYICTVLNKGTRYRLHLVKQIGDYETGEIVMKKDPEVLSENPISDSTFAAVKEGMRQVVADGTAAGVFNNTSLKVGGKTGTAEVSDGADNVLFTGFAPYDNPEIVVAVIIEHGAKSSFAAQIGKDIFEAYMNIYHPTPAE